MEIKRTLKKKGHVNVVKKKKKKTKAEAKT